MQYYDNETKKWNSWAASSKPQLKTEASKFLSADLVGSTLFVIMRDSRSNHCIYSFDTAKKVWENIPHSLGAVSELCNVEDYMYAIGSTLDSDQPQRYNFAKRRWQRYAKLIPNSVSEKQSRSFHNSGTTVFHSKVYLLYGSRTKSEKYWRAKPAILFYFDPVENKWEQKASTCSPHFGSTLFTVNDRLYVAGGNVKITESCYVPHGDSAQVEVYDEQNDYWSVVKQDHIPPNNLGAVEVEGRVYFIINRFPIDSGIRISPGEKYYVDLDDWENLGKVKSSSVLCYWPLNREDLNAE